MKRLLAATIALTFAGTAGALPLVMDITGELVSRSTARIGVPFEDDTSVAGTAFSARFVIELSEFGEAQFADTTGAERWSYAALAGATGISASLSIGGVAVDLTPYDRTRAVVSVLDSKGPIFGNCETGPCYSITPDQYSVNLMSTQTPPLSGNAQFRSLQFGTAASIDPLDYSSNLNFVNGAPLSLQDVLLLPSGLDNPLLESRLSFTDSYTICTDLCRLDYTEITRMRIGSLNRYVSSVPEPGTLGLFGLGLGGMLLACRRWARRGAGLNRLA